MSTAAEPTHRVARAVARVRADLAEVTDTALWSMDPAETSATIAAVYAAEAQLAELKTRLLLRAEQADLPAQIGATSVANWVGQHTQLTRRESHRQLRLAHALDQHQPTRTALAGGRIHVEQAEVILRAVAELPDGLDPALVEQAEAASDRRSPAL